MRNRVVQFLVCLIRNVTLYIRVFASGGGEWRIAWGKYRARSAWQLLYGMFVQAFVSSLDLDSFIWLIPCSCVMFIPFSDWCALRSMFEFGLICFDMAI